MGGEYQKDDRHVKEGELGGGDDATGLGVGVDRGCLVFLPRDEERSEGVGVGGDFRRFFVLRGLQKSYKGGIGGVGSCTFNFEVLDIVCREFGELRRLDVAF